ncbi:MAG TPA: four helix bundle protein [Kiritimatiellia bacterium]|nr:four helix bundle protein [Kiritimatiellia bacterium]
MSINIAEDCGTIPAAGRGRFLQIASGSAREFGAIRDILERGGLLDRDAARKGKDLLVRIVAMLTRMIGRGNQVREEGIVNGNGNGYGYEEDSGQPEGEGDSQSPAPHPSFWGLSSSQSKSLSGSIGFPPQADVSSRTWYPLPPSRLSIAAMRSSSFFRSRLFGFVQRLSAVSVSRAAD